MPYCTTVNPITSSVGVMCMYTVTWEKWWCLMEDVMTSHSLIGVNTENWRVYRLGTIVSLEWKSCISMDWRDWRIWQLERTVSHDWEATRTTIASSIWRIVHYWRKCDLVLDRSLITPHPSWRIFLHWKWFNMEMIVSFASHSFHSRVIEWVMKWWIDLTKLETLLFGSGSFVLSSNYNPSLTMKSDWRDDGMMTRLAWTDDHHIQCEWWDIQVSQSDHSREWWWMNGVMIRHAEGR